MIRCAIGATVVMLLAAAAPVRAGDRFALVVTGASGGDEYARKYDGWRQQLTFVLRDAFGYAADHLVMLGDGSPNAASSATRANVAAALRQFQMRTTKDDVLFVMLIGHGSAADEDTAKFNLVGPDLSVDEWASLLKPIAAQVVFVDTASGSYPFLRRLAGRGRIVVTANDSAQQTFETVFPEHFIRGLTDETADLDKNQRISVWEAFVYASDRVRLAYEQKGQLATERAMLDDTGGGVGVEAGTAGVDGAVAKVTYLQPEPRIEDTGDADLTALLRRRQQLDVDLEALRVKKSAMTAEAYEEALEALLVEIARVDRGVREKQRR